MKRLSAEARSGNVLIFILLAIFLLGALTIFLSRSGDQSNETGDQERASIFASDMLKFTGGVQSAVGGLLAQGCSENTLNFHHDRNPTEHINTNAPADHSCDVFHGRGGGISYEPVQDSWISTRNDETRSWHFTSSRCVYGVGTGGDSCGNANLELRMAVTGLSLAVCNEINRRMGVAQVSGGPPSDQDDLVPFTGEYAAAGGAAINTLGDSGTSSGLPLQRQRTACLRNSNGGQYIFYSVILAR